MVSSLAASPRCGWNRFIQRVGSLNTTCFYSRGKCKHFINRWIFHATQYLSLHLSRQVSYLFQARDTHCSTIKGSNICPAICLYTYVHRQSFLSINLHATCHGAAYKFARSIATRVTSRGCEDFNLDRTITFRAVWGKLSSPPRFHCKLILLRKRRPASARPAKLISMRYHRGFIAPRTDAYI